MEFIRITVDSAPMGGVPCVGSFRIPVATLAGVVADGMTEAEILKAHPDLAAADVAKGLRRSGHDAAHRPEADQPTCLRKNSSVRLRASFAAAAS